MQKANTAFERMYQSFGFFSNLSKRWGNDFIAMSAGANWVKASPAIQSCLHAELDAASTYRNYGRALGLRPVTDLLAAIEASLSKRSRSELAVTITQGTTEGACLILEALLNDGRLRPGDPALIIGHAYALYDLQSSRFGLQLQEILGDDQCQESFLPSIEQVEHTLNTLHPRIVFLVVPNNPLGEIYSEEQYRRIVEWCIDKGSYLLIDRVCMLPWDDRESLMSTVAPGIVAGQVFIVDSMAKAESLAGLRVGFLVTAPSMQPTLERLTQYRYLNPITFGTVTLAMSRVAEAGIRLSDTARRLISAHTAALYAEYPSDESRLDIDNLFPRFLEQYAAETHARKSIIDTNFATVRQSFESRTCRKLHLMAGFNVSLELPQMNWDHECQDQQMLGTDLGVGVLTESCFRISQRCKGRYFIRLGLTLTPNDFAEGIERLCSFYFRKP